MKKLFALLLVLGVLLAIPAGVSADIAFGLSREPNKKEKTSETTMNYIYNLEVSRDATDDIETISLKFRAGGSAVKSFTCVANDKYTVSQSTDDDLTICAFTAKDPDAEVGTQVSLGQLVAKIDLDADDDDCTIWYQLGDVEGKVTVNTGASVPYIIITGGIVLGAAVYFATKKKSKLQRI